MKYLALALTLAFATPFALRAQDATPTPGPVQKTGKTISKAVNKTGQTIEHGAKATARTVGKGVAKTGETIENAGKPTTHKRSHHATKKTKPMASPSPSPSATPVATPAPTPTPASTPEPVAPTPTSAQ
jgi:hypothetical protein